jgi:hypothetical protein
MLLGCTIKEACSTCERCRNEYILDGKPEGKKVHGKPGRRWEDNIKMDLTGKGYVDVDWIHSAQARW